MKKQILILLLCYLIIGLTSCSKEKNEAPGKNDDVTNEGSEFSQEENNSDQDEETSVQEESIGTQEESIGTQEETEDTIVPSISSSYFPVNGTYSNGSSDDFHYITISGIDQSSFSFTIHDGMTNNLVFKEHIAVFEEQDSTTAVYRGQSYTLFFDCSEYATITLTGFEELIAAPGNTFWNSNVLQSS